MKIVLVKPEQKPQRICGAGSFGWGRHAYKKGY
jgi:hypothetical protein